VRACLALGARRVERVERACTSRTLRRARIFDGLRRLRSADALELLILSRRLSANASLVDFIDAEPESSSALDIDLIVRSKSATVALPASILSPSAAIVCDGRVPARHLGEDVDEELLFSRSSAMSLALQCVSNQVHELRHDDGPRSLRSRHRHRVASAIETVCEHDRVSLRAEGGALV
jgi:hypothetical protein